MSDIEPPPDEDQMRTASEVARRCLVLSAVLAAGHKVSRQELIEWLRNEGLWASVSAEEASLLQCPSPTRQQTINATWRAEALLPLLWVLRAVDGLPPPTAICDVPLVQAALPPLFGPTAEFVATAALRDEADIWEAHEVTYQAHWAIRDAELNNKPIPHGYQAGIIQERHHALNWLTGYCGQSWDDVTTDT
jgi:hypothetical protein